MYKILLVDPDTSQNVATTRFLTERGYKVISIEDGSIGVQKALHELPDIILCDTNSRTLNGYEVLNTLQQINSTSIIPFVFITDNKSYEDIREVMNLGADDYIAKPYSLDDLVKLIEIRLEKQNKIIGLADEKFNTIMENSFAGAYIYQDDRFNYVNRKFCEIVGYTSRDLIGMNLVNIVYKDDISYVIEKINRCFIGLKKNLSVEFRAVRRDQEMINVIMTGSIADINKKKSLFGSISELENNSKNPGNANSLDIKITSRENEILDLICHGFSNNEIAEKLNISERTVEGHRANLLSKMNCKNSICLVVTAIKNNLVDI